MIFKCSRRVDVFIFEVNGEFSCSDKVRHVQPRHNALLAPGRIFTFTGGGFMKRPILVADVEDQKKGMAPQTGLDLKANDPANCQMRG